MDQGTQGSRCIECHRPIDPNTAERKGFLCDVCIGAIVEEAFKNGDLRTLAVYGAFEKVKLVVQERKPEPYPLYEALCVAVARGAREVVSFLLAAGADANGSQFSRPGERPLHLAARVGDVEMALLLMKHGANPDATTENGRTALYFAREHPAMAALLRARGSGKEWLERPPTGKETGARQGGRYCYGGNGFGSWSSNMKEEEIKTCPTCLLRTNSYHEYCPRCFTNLDTGERWGDPEKPPEGMKEEYCARCGTDNIGSNGVHVSNPPAGMGHTWCRDCIIDVQNGRPPKIFSPRNLSGPGGGRSSSEAGKKWYQFWK